MDHNSAEGSTETQLSLLNFEGTELRLVRECFNCSSRDRKTEELHLSPEYWENNARTPLLFY